jgi:hypothetical protein
VQKPPLQEKKITQGCNDYTVPNLVHRLVLWSIKRAVVVDGVFFEEKPYLVTRRQEILVTDMVVVTRGEFGLLPSLSVSG